MNVFELVDPEVVAEHQQAIDGLPVLDRVPNRVFREAFLVSGLPVSELARRLGFMRSDGGVDSSRAARLLGLMEQGKRHDRPWASSYRQLSVSYEVAVRLCDALGIDYFEVGV